MISHTLLVQEMAEHLLPFCGQRHKRRHDHTTSCAVHMYMCTACNTCTNNYGDITIIIITIINVYTCNNPYCVVVTLM